MPITWRSSASQLGSGAAAATLASMRPSGRIASLASACVGEQGAQGAWVTMRRGRRPAGGPESETVAHKVPGGCRTGAGGPAASRGLAAHLVACGRGHSAQDAPHLCLRQLHARTQQRAAGASLLRTRGWWGKGAARHRRPAIGAPADHPISTPPCCPLYLPLLCPLPPPLPPAPAPQTQAHRQVGVQSKAVGVGKRAEHRPHLCHQPRVGGDQCRRRQHAARQ